VRYLKPVDYKLVPSRRAVRSDGVACPVRGLTTLMAIWPRRSLSAAETLACGLTLADALSGIEPRASAWPRI